MAKNTLRAQDDMELPRKRFKSSLEDLENLTEMYNHGKKAEYISAKPSHLLSSIFNVFFIQENLPNYNVLKAKPLDKYRHKFTKKKSKDSLDLATTFKTILDKKIQKVVIQEIKENSQNPEDKENSRMVIPQEIKEKTI